MGLREEILGASDRPIGGPVDVPEWGVKVWLRSMTLRDRLDINASRTGDIVPIALVVVRGLCDSTGQRIFTDDDQEAVDERSADVLQRVFMQILEFNGMTPDEEIEAGND